MKLFYDARYIRPIDDGVSRYSTQIALALAKLTNVTFIISDEEQLKKLPSGASYVKIHPVTSAKEIFLPRVLNKFKPDVVFSPLHGPGVFGRHYKSILTSHDLIYYHYHTPPHSLTNPLLRIIWRLYFSTYLSQRIILNSADLVVTVSESAKKEFEAAHITTRPILVVPNAPSQLGDLLSAAPDLTKPPRSIIYMGAFIGYKNVETLIKAMAVLPDYTLHLLSRISLKRQTQLSNLAPAGAKLVFHNGVSDKEYAELLANNALLATATLDEGYGLPVAEALTLGVPAVISDIPVLHEVGGNGALYFDPHSPEDFANKVKELDDAALRATLSAAGKAHIATFDWNKSANILYAAILSLTNRS